MSLSGSALTRSDGSWRSTHPVIANFGIVLGEWRSLATGILQHGLDLRALGLSPGPGGFRSMLPCRAGTGAPATQGVVDVLRAIPFLMLLFIVYYCLPTARPPVELDVRALALIVYNTAYFAEILRGDLVPPAHEQEEAGRAYVHGLRLYRRSSFHRSSSRPGPSSADQMITPGEEFAFLMVSTDPGTSTFMAKPGAGDLLRALRDTGRGRPYDSLLHHRVDGATDGPGRLGAGMMIIGVRADLSSRSGD